MECDTMISCSESSSFALDISYEGRHVRVVGTPDAPEWVAADVCAVLGLSNVTEALRGFSASERGSVVLNTSGGPQESFTVTEAGLYRLIFRSRKPAAERFRQWVTHEVLPCIRRCGCYPAPEVQLWDQRAIVPQLADQITRGLMPIFERVAIVQAETQREVQEVRGEVREFKSQVCLRLDSLERRKPLTVATQRIHLAVVHSYYGGRCPICRVTAIVDHLGARTKELQFDHWRTKGNAALHATIPTCGECNHILERAGERQRCQPAFDDYQRLVVQYQARKQKTLFVL